MKLSNFTARADEKDYPLENGHYLVYNTDLLNEAYARSTTLKLAVIRCDSRDPNDAVRIAEDDLYWGSLWK